MHDRHAGIVLVAKRQRLRQRVVQLHRGQRHSPRREVTGQGTPPRSDLQDRLILAGADRADNLALQIGVDEEILAKRALRTSGAHVSGARVSGARVSGAHGCPGAAGVFHVTGPCEE